jgi:phage terminase large subunit
VSITKLPYTPRPHALSYHARAQRFAVLIWHRRAGKTVMCLTDLIEKAMRNTLPMPEYGYVDPFRNQAKNVAWKYLMFLSESVREYKNEAKLYVRLVNGAKIRLYGVDNAESMRGGYFDGV